MKKIILLLCVVLSFASLRSQNVGVGTNTPQSKLDISGSVGTAITTVSGATTLDATYSTVLVTPSSAYTITLPAVATSSRRVYTIVYNAAAGGNTITIKGNALENITNAGVTANTLALTGGSVILQSDGTKWYATTSATTTGTVTSVGATAPLSSSGGASPNISLTGVVPIANGGTNSGTALSGSSVMTSNGTSIVQGPAGTTTTVLHGNAAGAPAYGAVSLTTDVSGILPVANGGTGSSTQGWVDLTTNQTAAGNKTWSGIGAFTSGTASSSTTTGAVVVTGGEGISGNVNVGGTVTAGGSAVMGTGISGGYYQDVTNGAYRSIVSSATTNGYYFQTNAGAATTMYVGLGGSYNGNVGIGTTTPAAALSLYQDRYTLYGPNSTWASYLRVGGNGGNIDAYASVATTNGNLHLDASSVGPGNAMYLNYYKGAGGINFGNGASAVIGSIDNTGYLSMNNAINSGVGYRVGGAAASGSYLRGNGTNFVSSGILAADLPTGSGNYIQNQISADQAAGFRINGKGDIDNGSPYAVPNGYMAAGSLTVGGITASYGGGSGWNASTAGILMENNGTTEIAMHHSGARIASAMYYNNNTITVGRDMGWGPIATEILYGNVGIGMSPGGPLDVNGRASATSFKVSSSFGDLVNNSPWYGIGMSNLTLSGQGSTAVQIGGYYGLNFAESGANRMVINLGNVGIGTTTPNGKVDIYNTGANGDGAVFAPDITLDNNFTIQTYIDATAGGGWANRTSYAGTCCNNLALNPDVGTVSVGGVSGNYGSNKFNVIGNSYFSGTVGIGTTAPARTLEVNNSFKLTNSGSDANDGVMCVGCFGPGFDIVGIRTDGTSRKVA